MSIAHDLKQAMALWPSGVAVVSAIDEFTSEAVTVTSLVSVSLEPPLILVSLSHHSAVLSIIQQTRRFTVSILAADQKNIAAIFADRVPQQRKLFTEDPDPIVRDALAGLVCSVFELHAAGDHTLCVGQVEEVRFEREAEALLYVKRKYR